MHKHNGKCHCGNIHYTLETIKNVSDFILRQCDCSFCQKHGGRYTSDPDGSLTITVKDDSLISAYQFGHKTADFIICRTCGVMPFVTCNLGDNKYAVLNVNTLDEVEALSATTVQTMSFGGEEKSSRLERRQKNWIGSVRYS